MRDYDPVVKEYSYDLQAGQRAPGTIRNYTTTLRLWRDWLDQQDDGPDVIAAVRKEHVARWLAGRADIESPETVLTRHRHLRAFFKWAEREEIIDKNPMATLREPSAPPQP